MRHFALDAWEASSASAAATALAAEAQASALLAKRVSGDDADRSPRQPPVEPAPE
jgi:hypothetical protein